MSSTTTLVYSRVDDLEIRLDIDFPSKEKSIDTTIPALIFFHGGGLVGGNRQSFIPMQLKRKSILLFTTQKLWVSIKEISEIFLTQGICCLGLTYLFRRYSEYWLSFYFC